MASAVLLQVDERKMASVILNRPALNRLVEIRARKRQSSAKQPKGDKR